MLTTIQIDFMSLETIHFPPTLAEDVGRVGMRYSGSTKLL